MPLWLQPVGSDLLTFQLRVTIYLFIYLFFWAPRLEHNVSPVYPLDGAVNENRVLLMLNFLADMIPGSEGAPLFILMKISS